MAEFFPVFEWGRLVLACLVIGKGEVAEVVFQGFFHSLFFSFDFPQQIGVVGGFTLVLEQEEESVFDGVLVSAFDEFHDLGPLASVL